METYIALGLMSGTSLDGLDLALCRFTLERGKWSFELTDSSFVLYDEKQKEMLLNVYSGTALDLVKADVLFGRFLGEQAAMFLKKHKGDVDLIASHGQTIFHCPEDGYTCQIGSGAEIASITGLPTISDFRVMDVARGGQGAPLVPLGDELLFGDYDACVNLGGFANISYNKEGKRVAFDICPVNMVLNHLAYSIGEEFDKDGKVAKLGSSNELLLRSLEELPYYRQKWPKSLGKEWVDKNIYPLLNDDVPTKDLLHTFTKHIVLRLSEEIDKLDGEKVLLTGGGAKNSYLVEQLVKSTEKDILVPSLDIVDMKEAIVFAFLGVLRYRNEINSLASVTGAFSNSIGGVIHLP